MEKIEIIKLQSGEENIWFRLDVPNETATEKHTEVKIELEKGDNSSHCFLMARKDTKYVGRLHGEFIVIDLFYIHEITPINPSVFDCVGSAFCEFLVTMFSSDSFKILTWDNSNDRENNRLLSQSGFGIQNKKIFVEKDLRGYSSPYNDPFEYRSLGEVGNVFFLSVLTASSEGDPFKDPGDDDPEKSFKSLIEYAGKSFNPDWWKIGFLGSRPAGIVLPQLFSWSNRQGSIFYMGIHPEFRGQGLGKILHAKGLSFLAENNVQLYKGSTETRNIPMKKIFVSNGCTIKGTQLFWCTNEVKPRIK